jgi:ABC-type Zn uptake system ZnuABC Zn-binding protein ZnuA
MFWVDYRWKFGAFALVAVVAGSLPPFDAKTEARTPIPVVVTIPILKDLTEQVGGHHVRVTSLLNGYENEHTYSPKPTDLVAVRKARLLFEVGLGLEVWVSSLVKNAGSKTLRVVTTSHGVELIHDGGDPHEDHHSGGDATDSEGNPHIWLDPVNALIMLRHITEALIEIDPSLAAEFRANQAAYQNRLSQLLTDLSARTQLLPDRRFIAHHSAWPYLARRFDLHIVDTIHIQAGAEPSAHHLQSLIEKIRKERVMVIASEIQLSQRLPELLSRETNARVVVLTTMPGGLPGTETYLDMLRYNVLQLAGALDSN